MLIELCGFVVLCYFGIEIIKEVYKCWKSNPNIQLKYGQNCWALVTGASDGIGKGFCEALARQGVNVCLVVRNVQKAKQVVSELEKLTNKSQFRIVQADFENCMQPDFYINIANQVKDLDIGLVVNNVGVLSVGKLKEIKDQDLIQQIQINCVPSVLLTKQLWPQLQKRNKSGVIFLSSMTGRFAMPFYQGYSASKAFNDYFALALAQECSNIDVLALRPFFVQTAMTNNKWDPSTITPTQCVYGALSRLGLESASHGYWRHRLQGCILNFLQGDLLNKVLPIVAGEIIRTRH